MFKSPHLSGVGWPEKKGRLGVACYRLTGSTNAEYVRLRVESSCRLDSGLPSPGFGGSGSSLQPCCWRTLLCAWI